MKEFIQQPLPFEGNYPSVPTCVLEVVVQKTFQGKSQEIFKKLVRQIDEKKQVLHQW